MPNDFIDLVPPGDADSQWGDAPAKAPATRDPGRRKKRWNSSELVILITSGVLALALVVAVVAFLAGSIARNDDASSQTQPVASEPVQWMTWSQSMPDGQIVQLRGALPDGYPTETYLGSQLLDRDAGGDFGWDLGQRIPEPIAMMDSRSCDELLDDANFWMGGAQDLTENGLIDASYRQLAYAGYALELREKRGCD